MNLKTILLLATILALFAFAFGCANFVAAKLDYRLKSVSPNYIGDASPKPASSNNLGDAGPKPVSSSSTLIDGWLSKKMPNDSGGKGKPFEGLVSKQMQNNWGGNGKPMVYNDDWIDTRWAFSNSRLNFAITNHSGRVLKIIWDEVVFINLNKQSCRVGHLEQKYNEMGNSQLPTIILPDQTLQDFLIPSSNVHFSQGWIEDPFLYYHEGQKLPDGTTVTVFFPISSPEGRREYTLVFEVSQID